MSLTVSALQKAVYQALSQSADIEALIGSGQIFDHENTKPKYPYVSIVNWRCTDWSTDTDSGEEHLFEVEVWDDQPAMKKVQNIARHIRQILHDQPLVLDMGKLVNLRIQSSSFGIEGQIKLQRGRLVFRAVIEL